MLSSNAAKFWKKTSSLHMMMAHFDEISCAQFNLVIVWVCAGYSKCVLQNSRKWGPSVPANSLNLKLPSNLPYCEQNFLYFQVMENKTLLNTGAIIRKKNYKRKWWMMVNLSVYFKKISPDPLIKKFVHFQSGKPQIRMSPPY